MLCVLRCSACELLVAVDENELSIAVCPRCDGRLEKVEESRRGESDGETAADE